ncbi:MAG TPA: NrdH-redoxin [Actinobacteria bacterium]|nr:NrdH-redoxin [Actinomycetota bacterium]
MDQPRAHRVQLLSKPHCHLCDDARAVVSAVCAELDIPWSELSIMDDPALYDEYWERIPVVLVDDRVVQFWRVNPELLRGVISV